MEDGKAYITVKKARIARAGNQIYSAQEMLEQGITLKDGKTHGIVYRPPEVLIKNKDKFANAPFVNDHTPVNVTPDNWKDYTIGFVSGKTDVEVHDNEVWLVGDVVFYDRKAYDAYKNGKVELSASYDVKLGVPQDPATAGYDAVLLDIPGVNHVALCDRARAGHSARVLDSISIAKKNLGGEGMKILSGFLSSLGIGKAKDSGKKFSVTLMDSIAKVHTLKDDELEKEIESVMTHVTSLGDSDARGLLIGAVSDCFKNPVEVLAQKDKVAEKIDELYGKCLDADAEVVKRILDVDKKDGDKEDKKEGDKDEGDKDEGDKEEKPAKDSLDLDARIEAAVTKSVTGLSDSIVAKIDAMVKDRLGIDNKPSVPANGSPAMVDSVSEDASYLVRGIFGNN